jgi:YgiT-type zinc finger domain-containing protein
MDKLNAKETIMKCTVGGCPGEYEQREIAHIIHQGNLIMVIDRVPAEVCPICGDILFTPDTVRRLEQLRRQAPPPKRTVPLYDFTETKSA